MADDSGDECKFGCDFPQYHTARYAGTGLFLPERPAIFYYSSRVFAWRPLVDRVFEPFMAVQSSGSLAARLFGVGKGSGAAALFFVIGIAGVVVCLIFTLLLKKFRWKE